nr:SPOR domain-containing protein [uncultured Desulfobacter sp.]
MVRIVRHISVRFCLTTLMVLPSGFLLFPRLSGWLSDMPASVFIVFMYLLLGLGLGISMDISGAWRIKRLIREGQLWERSGIASRAEKNFIRAVRIYDSAWISPLAARRTRPMLLSSLARFYLSSGSRRREIQRAASAWLAQNPKDESLARFWLERIQDQDGAETYTHAILTVLADTWYADPDLCRTLVDLFLDQGRMDFSARRLYRAFLDMVDMPSEISSQDKVRAKTVRHMMSERLATPEPDVEGLLSESRGGTLGDERVDSTAFMRMGQSDDQASEDVPVIPGKTGKAKQAVLSLIQVRERWWRRLWGMMIVCVGIWLIFFVWGTVSHMLKKPVEQPAQQIKIIMPKPFTIQVAAYHKKAHAEKYMATLAEKGIDATMKETAGGGKTWYLVRVSEFTDQKSAQVYGNRLKADHIIDEFFVTQN